jgi:hypothetical protein
VAQLRIHIDGAAVAELMRSPAGPPGRYLIERAEVVRQAARAKAPVRDGCLRSSIVKRLEVRPEGLAVRIIADTTPCSPTRKSYALFVEEDTKPHIIEGNPTLAFQWDHGPSGAGLYFFASVSHPGTRGKHFMRDALPLAVA